MKLTAISFLVVVCCLCSPAFSEGANDQNTHTTVDGEVSRPFSIPIRVIDAPAQTQADILRLQQAEQRDIEDLAAQRAMAKSAEETVWLAKLQLLLTVIGTIGVLWSLNLSRVATRAAIAAVTLSRDTAERQLRAYLYLHSCRIVEFDGGYNLEAEIKNGGQTPAYDVRVMTESYFDDYPDGGDRPHYEPLDTHSSTVGPNHNIISAQRLLTNAKEEFFGKVRTGERGFWFQGKVVYTDAFGKPRFLKFRHVLGGHLPQTGSLLMHADKHGNESD